MGGFGPFEEDDENIVNRDEALETEEIVSAFAEGLTRAFAKKARLRTLDCVLVAHLVGCRKFPVRMFRDIVARAAAKVTLDNFTHVHVFDGEEGYHIEVR